MKITSAFTFVLVTAVILSGQEPEAQTGLAADRTAPYSPVSSQVVANILKLPLAFERADRADGYVARARGYSVVLEAGSARIAFEDKDQRKAVTLALSGAKPGAAKPSAPLPGKVNYYQGSDSKAWRLGKDTYERVTYPEAYPGIDVVYYGNQQQLSLTL